jgi:eukaryotic-like serine/threonine-protein kinase
VGTRAAARRRHRPHGTAVERRVGLPSVDEAAPYPAPMMTAPPPPPPPAPPTRVGPGVRLGSRYRLLGQVGRGGMAVVYRAHDEVLDRLVAVKIPDAHLGSDPAFRDRFRREAQAAAALSHPNVVTVHDWGETPDGAYLVLQLVDGPSLREVLRTRDRLSPREALAVLGPTAAGLAAAHEAGLVHRDVKPENVLLGRDGTVRITDFGLARAAASATSTFGPDVLVGSPHYLSPEAVQLQPLDARSDVYALGVVLFECLTGQPPHQAESPFATAVAHTARPVPAPSELVAGLSPGIDEVVRRATERDRDRRTPDAAAFGRELAAVVVGGPAHLQPLVPAASRAAAASRVLPLDDDAPPAHDGPPPHPSAAPSAAFASPDPERPLRGDDAGRPDRRRDPERPVRRHDTAVLAAPDPADTATTTVRPEPLPAARTGRAGGSSASSHRRPPPPTHDDPRDLLPAPRRRRGRGWLAALLVLLLLGAAGMGGYLLWDRVIAPLTVVPSVLGVAADLAADELTAAGFTVRVAEEQPYDLGVPAGHVLAQLPEEAARLGSTVELVLSAGPRPVEVPEVAGRREAEAVARVTAAGLEPDVTRVHDETVREGAVVRSDPPGGAIRDEGSPVALSVSLGPAPIAVPALVGVLLDDAVAIVRAEGLELVVAERRDDAAPRDTVVGQSPGPDAAPLVRGDTVEVVVSDGPAPVSVPRVRGRTVDDATAVLEAAGFEVAVERRGGFAAFLQPDRVYDQDPAPGTPVERGTLVQLYAYDG